jgi:hypothetical protein
MSKAVQRQVTCLRTPRQAGIFCVRPSQNLLHHRRLLTSRLPYLEQTTLKREASPLRSQAPRRSDHEEDTTTPRRIPVSKPEMSASDSKDIPGEVAEGSHESSNDPEPTNSIWTTPLRPGQIRLFNIELDEGDSISGALEVFEHQSAPRYFAQSYVCGEGECDFKITVNGNAHYIKPNLSIALRQTKRALRDSGGESGYNSQTTCTWLWIDAICIGQDNVTELGMQIRFMNHIYMGAELTFVSLGLWTELQRLISLFTDWASANQANPLLREEEECCATDDDRARRTVAILSSRAKHERCLQTDFSVSEEEIRSIWSITKEILCGRSDDSDKPSQLSQALSYYHPFWQACIQLFENDWFTRLWTYQELILSPRLYLTLQTSVPWEFVDVWREALNGHLKFADKPLHPEPGFNYNGRLVQHQNRTMSFKKPGALRQDIWSLLVTTAHRRAKVPKDHVFAILGLMDEDTRKLIDVDYSKKDAQVFREIVLLAIRTSTVAVAARKLPTLWESLAWVATITPGLPSWVPDFNNEANAPVGITKSKFLDRYSKTISYAFFDAAQLRISPDNELIFLKVLEMDVVSTRFDSMFPMWTLDIEPRLPQDTVMLFSEASVLLWTRSFCETLSDSEAGLPAMARLNQFLVETAWISMEQVELMVGFARRDIQISGDRNVVEGFRASLGPWPDHELLRQFLVQLYFDPERKKLVEELEKSIAHLKIQIGGTYFFATSGGRLGRSPKPVSPGDRICLVPGGRLFHIFSDTVPSRYITCAAIHGLMGDHLPDLVRELGQKWEEITIH